MTNTYDITVPRCEICGTPLPPGGTVMCRHCDKAFSLGYKLASTEAETRHAG